MKKIILIALLSMLSISGFSQSRNKVYKSTLLYFDGEEWVAKKSTYPKSMYITIKDKRISINNESQSRFTMYGESRKTEYDSHNCYTWDCIDEEGVDCLFMFKRMFEDDRVVLSFVYTRDGYMLQYIIEK